MYYRAKYVKKFYSWVDVNKNGKVSQREFVWYFNRFLAKRHACTGVRKQCSYCIRKRTKFTIIAALTTLYCHRRRANHRIHYYRFLSQYFHQNKQGRSLPLRAFRSKLIKAIPRQYKGIRNKLKKLR